MPRILVVDDDPELLDNVRELLTEEGFEAITAGNGVDAVALAKARGPDLVVCDIAMPLMDGYQVLSALRAQPSTTHLPFIFLSARAERNEHRGEAGDEQTGGDDGVAPDPGLRLRLRQPLERGAGEIDQVRRHQRQHARRQEAHEAGDQGGEYRHVGSHGAYMRRRGIPAQAGRSAFARM